MQQVYEWMRNFALFYILLTAALQLIPNKKYEKYIRFFMGILMIFMLMMPIMTILKNGISIRDIFNEKYQQEKEYLDLQEKENIQQLYLKKVSEETIKKQLELFLKEKGETLKKIEINWDDILCITVYKQGESADGLKERIVYVLREKYGLMDEEYKICIQ